MVGKHNYLHVAQRLKERWGLELSVKEYLEMIEDVDKNWEKIDVLLHHEKDQYVINYTYKNTKILMIYDARWRRVRTILADDANYEGEYQGWLGKGMIWDPRLLLTCNGVTTPALLQELREQVYWHNETVPVQVAYLGEAMGEVKGCFWDEAREMVKIRPLVDERNKKDLLYECDVLWVDDGSVFYLMDFLIKNRLLGSIEDFLLQGGLYVGVGGGSLITNNKLPAYVDGLMEDPLSRGIKNRKGLALVDKWFIYLNRNGVELDVDYLKGVFNNRKLKVLGPDQGVMMHGKEEVKWI